MNSQKRRKNRVQGSWASQQTKSVREVEIGCDKFPPFSSRMKFNSTSEAADENQDKSMAGGNNSPQISANRGRSFVFEQEIAKSVKLAPPVKVISCEGVYDISVGPSGVSRLEFHPNFLTSDESQWMFEQLHTEIPWQAKNIKVKGEYHRQPRLTAWFGDFSYTYSGLVLQPFQWSPTLELLREKIFVKTRNGFNSMLANLYRNEKDSVDWHCDDEPSLGEQPTIASLSFGETRNFELRKKPLEGNDCSLAERIKIPLSPGSLLIMSGSVQQDWQHRVPKEYHDRGPRINLTFRNIQSVDTT